MNNRYKILAFALCFCFGVAAKAQGIPTFDASDVFQTTITAQQEVTQTARQLQQYQAQLQQLQNQIQNTNNPSSFQWDNANATINNILATLNTLNTYKTQAGNMNAYLNQYQNANQYQASCIGTGGCTDAQIQQLNNSQLVGSTSQKTANDNMLLNINAQQQQLQSDANNLVTLQQSAQSSAGQMQAMQAANQLASNQAAQLLQIRTLLVAEQTANATRAETIADREAQQQAAHNAFVGGQPTPGPAYNILNYAGAP